MEEKNFEQTQSNADVDMNKVDNEIDINSTKEKELGVEKVDAEHLEKDVDDADKLIKLERDLIQARDALDAMRLDYLRAVANSENIRRRADEDIKKAYKFSIEKFSKDLLPVLDSLEAALMHAENGEIAKEGVECTQAQLLKVLENNNVKVCSPAINDRFDPHTHQAMAAVISDQEPNSIVSVMQKGYLLNERVLRPALVTVAKSSSESV